MTWVCAECGGDFLFHGHIVKDGHIVGQDIRCSKDESHRGQTRLENFEARRERKEVMEKQAKKDLEDLFGPPDLR